MIWTPLPDSSAVDEWLLRISADVPPSSYRVPRPQEIRQSILKTTESLSESGVAVTMLPSGFASFQLDLEQGSNAFPRIEGLVNELTRAIDPEREWFYWTDLDSEEQPPAHVHHDLCTKIDGTTVLGPGGRLIKQLIGTTAVFDLSVHPRQAPGITAAWRGVTAVAGRLREALVGRADARVRAAFGYYEPSAFELAEVIRPVFVFVVDQPSRERFPRWRVTLVESATSSDDLPPELGLEGVAGACV
jgi:hypothetical protein